MRASSDATYVLQKFGNDLELVLAHGGKSETLYHRIQVVFGYFKYLVLLFDHLEGLAEVAPDFVALVGVDKAQADVFSDILLLPRNDCV